MASGPASPRCCSSSEWSASELLSVLQSRLSPLLSPFSRTTSQWLLEASLPRGDSPASPGGPPSASSGFAAPSRFSLLLESQCLLLSLARRRRAGLRPPPLLFGLLDGLLVRLSEGADFLLEAGEAVGEATNFSSLPPQLLRLQLQGGQQKASTFRQVVEASRGRDGGQVVLSHPQQVLALAAGVEAVLSQVSGGQEGTGVKALPRKFDNLLGFDPATVDELEALQVDDLRSRDGVAFRAVWTAFPPSQTPAWD